MRTPVEAPGFFLAHQLIASPSLVAVLNAWPGIILEAGLVTTQCLAWYYTCGWSGNYSMPGLVLYLWPGVVTVLNA